MSDHDALVAAICADPDDDTPRLAYADWLDEHDQSAQAAFVRAQVELARTPPWEPFAVACRWRHRDWLTGRPFRHTLPPSDGFQLEWHPEAFRRGLGWRMNVRGLVAWEQLSPGILGRAPVGELHLWTATLDQWVQFAESPVVPHLRKLHFVTSPIEPLRVLRDRPAALGITDLHFDRASGAGMPVVVEDLLRSPLGSAVSGLHFRVGFESLEDLIDALGPARLERLSLSTMGLTAAHVQRLCDHPVVAGLRELDVQKNPLGSDGVAKLVADLPPALHSLSLAGVGLGAEGVEQLARRGAGLRRLDLSDNPLTPRAARLLGRSASLAGLRSLGLAACHVGERALHHLVRAKFWAKLVELDLRDNPVPAAGVRHLLDAPVPADLAALVLDERVGRESRAELVRKYGERVVFTPPATSGV